MDSVESTFRNIKIQSNYTFLILGTIDISSSLVREKREIQASGTGGTYKITTRGSPVYVSVKDNNGKAIIVNKENENLYSIPFVEKFIVNLVYGSSYLSMLPKEISQTEQQYVLFDGNLFVDTPYETNEQKTRVILFSSNVLSTFPVSNEGKKSSKERNYGPYENVKGNDYEQLRIHEANSSPFLSLKLRREVWISHWANDLTVNEWYELHNYGAKLKNNFARSVFMVQRDPGVSVVKTFTIELPKGAENVFYRDDIGNVSTSHFRQERNRAVLELQPRYPLFGGWNYTWHQGYGLQLERYLRVFDDETHLLKFPIVGSIPGAIIEEFELKVILPEGSVVRDVTLPFKADREVKSLVTSYVDTIGRPVVEIHKKYLVDENAEDFLVTFF
jgi:oligosaccharyltransferase complex subunit alpha (ribophorin I)